MKFLVIVLAFSLILLAGCTSAPKEKSYISDSLQSLKENWGTQTSSGKDTLCNSMRGKYVSWAGIVKDIDLNSEYNVMVFAQSPETKNAMADAGLQLRSDSKTCALNFRKGDMISFEGELVSCNNAITGDIFYINDGTILNCSLPS